MPQSWLSPIQFLQKCSAEGTYFWQKSKEVKNSERELQSCLISQGRIYTKDLYFRQNCIKREIA